MKLMTLFKKILFVSTLLTFTPISCYAIQLSQPQKLGSFYQAQAGGGGMVIQNATSNNGDFYTKIRKNNRSSYGKGIAVFGTGDDALYLHYNLYSSAYNSNISIGGKNIHNTISLLDSVADHAIFRVRSNEGITFFPVHSAYDIISMYTIYGRQKDGKFIKYIDTEDITKNYIGWGKYGAPSIEFTDFAVQGDTLIMHYVQSVPVRSRNNVGEFRFKWDDKAQWFGVEHVVY